MNRRLLACLAVCILAGCDRDPAQPDERLVPTVEIIAGDQQQAPAGLELPVEPTVRVTDRAGVAQPGVAVLWRVMEGGGTVDAHRTITDSSGLATIRWTLGEEIGSQLLYAAVEGSPGVTFRAQAGLFFTEVATGWRHTCGLDALGLAWCWGDNSWGQLGNGTREPSVTSSMVTGRRQFDSVVAGTLHTCALTAAGAAYCWGDNGSGQLGNGTTRSSTVPVVVLGGLQFDLLALGYDHTCGRTVTGELFCWGNNTHGQLGIRADETCSLGGLNAPCERLPVQVPLSEVVVAAAAGEGHTCAVTGTQRAYCWGHNDWGQLGVGRFGGTEDAPVRVLGTALFEDVAAWGRSTCGLDASGGAYCWGQNSAGKLGINSTLNLDRPAPVSATSSPLVQLDMGDDHTCARAASGSIYCWGAVLGNGTGDRSLVPVEVSGGREYTSLSAGGAQSCAFSDGVWCWGSNEHGQLGVPRDSVRIAQSPVHVRPAPPPTGGQ